jgi:hypothetical protein
MELRSASSFQEIQRCGRVIWCCVPSAGSLQVLEGGSCMHERAIVKSDSNLHFISTLNSVKIII